MEVEAGDLPWDVLPCEEEEDPRLSDTLALSRLGEEDGCLLLFLEDEEDKEEQGEEDRGCPAARLWVTS